MDSKNTIVCFSYNAPPLNDPEAFCTGRLLSSLVQEGKNVHLITMDHLNEIGDNALSQLLDSKIKITKIKKIPKPKKLKVFKENLRHKYFGPNSWEISLISKEINDILKLYEDPVLLTRSLPILSNIVGYYNKSQSHQWIAHFSDPFPGFDQYSGKTLYKKFFDKRWCQKIINKADDITVTCNKAKFFFLKHQSANKKIKINSIYHIGFPSLEPKRVELNWKSNNLHIIHVGNLTDRRYASVIVAEFHKAAAKWKEFKFVQFGRVDVKASKILNKKFKWLNIESDRLTSPNIASYILDQADINVIIDTDEQLNYSPYLPSKFAYAIAAGKPILGIGKENSEMGYLATKYGSFYFADVSRPNSILEELNKIQKNRDNLMKPSKELSDLFQPKTVALDFISLLK